MQGTVVPLNSTSGSPTSKLPFGRRMPSPSVVSNGAKVREDETEVLAGSREVALCLPIDLEAAFRFRLRNALRGKCVEGVAGMVRNHLDV